MIDTRDILQGKYDDDLNRIETTCRERRKMLRNADAAMTMSSVEVGNRVRIKDISPKYLVGALAVVVSKRRTKLEIELEKTCGRFHAGTPLIIPSICVEII